MGDIDERLNRIVGWIRDQVADAGTEGTVLGLSGGVDSAVVAALCQRALAEQALGLILPCHSFSRDIEDAQLVARTVGIRTETIDLSGPYDLLLSLLPKGGELLRANLKPRLRMLTLYYFANLRNALVVGTSNAAELAVGYFTKYGDGGSDILPIGRLLKGEVREVAKHLGIPRRVIDRPPSAGLWEEQTDEEELGFRYTELEAFLLGERVAPAAAERIRKRIAASDHKRRPPLIPSEI